MLYLFRSVYQFLSDILKGIHNSFTFSGYNNFFLSFSTILLIIHTRILKIT